MATSSSSHVCTVDIFRANSPTQYHGLPLPPPKATSPPDRSIKLEPDSSPRPSPTPSPTVQNEPDNTPPSASRPIRRHISMPSRARISKPLPRIHIPRASKPTKSGLTIKLRCIQAALEIFPLTIKLRGIQAALREQLPVRSAFDDPPSSGTRSKTRKRASNERGI